MSRIKTPGEMVDLMRVLKAVGKKVHFDATYHFDRRVLLATALYALSLNFFIEMAPSSDIYGASLRITNHRDLEHQLVPMKEIIAAAMGESNLDMKIHKKTYIYLTRAFELEIERIVKGYGFKLRTKDAALPDYSTVLIGQLEVTK